MRGALVEHNGVWVPRDVADGVAAARYARAPGPPVQFWDTRLPYAPMSNQPTAAQLLDNVKGWGAIATRAIAERIQSIPIETFATRTTSNGTTVDEVLDDHILTTVLRRPNPMFTGTMMKRLLVYHLLFTGTGYWQKIRDGLGTTVELWPIPPQTVTPIYGPRGIEFYQIYSNTAATKIPADDVVYFWTPDPRTVYGAMGTLGPQATEWDSLRYLQEHIREYFAQDATPRVTLTHDGTKGGTSPTQDQRNEFYDDWAQRFNRRVGKNRGLPAFLPTGFDPVQLTSSAGDPQLTQFDQQYTQQLLAAWGVPGSILGMVVDVNRAAAETNQYVFDRNTIMPICDLIAETLTVSLAMEYDSNLAVRFVPFVEPDKAYELMREAQDLATKVRSIQQVRADRGLDPGAAPWGELPVGTVADVPYDGSAPELFAVDDTAPRGEPATVHAEAMRRLPSADVMWARVIANEKKWNAKYERAVASVWDRQRKATVAAVRAQWPDEPRTGALAAFANDVMLVPEGYARAVKVDEILDHEKWQGVWAAFTDPLRIGIYSLSATEALADFSVETFSLKKNAVASLKAVGAKMAKGIDRATQRKVASQLSSGLEAGEGVDQIAKRINGVFNDRGRARTIARTEVGRAHSMGTIEGWEQSGVVEGKTWNTSRDSFVRDSHQIDGQTVPLDGKFTLADGARATMPLDPALPVEDVANCRCFSTATILPPKKGK